MVEMMENEKVEMTVECWDEMKALLTAVVLAAQKVAWKADVMGRLKVALKVVQLE